ncbi:hypothetical protein HDU84_008096 [Entophlyctis sp. JEL0112]|nr:hypothetical protein HDU84_008096 [Entophlyctis sp. JEL0112]
MSSLSASNTSSTNGHSAPFILFAKIMPNIAQIPHKHHFKTYQNTFRNDVLLNAVTAPPFNFSANDAMECLGGLLLAQLIVNVEKPFSVNIEKGPFVVSAKGNVVLRDVSGNRIDERPPQVVFSDRNAKLKTGIIYLDRDTSGTLSLCQPTMEALFRYAVGEKFPNVTRPDPTSLLAADTCSSSSVVTREEAVIVMGEFVNQGWIENVSDEISRDSSRVVFHCTALGARVARWEDVPTIGGFFARKKSEAIPGSRLSSAFDSREVNSPRLSELANEALNKTGPSKSMTSIASPQVPSCGVPNEFDELDWESCHTKLISMDGSKGRAKEPGGSISGPSTPIGGLPNDGQDALDLLPMDSTTERDPAVTKFTDRIRSHVHRLRVIIDTPKLYEQFRRYMYFMFSQENLNFWKDVDAFRRMYAPGATVVPGQALALDTETIAPVTSQIVAHAMAMYLKYIVDDGPYEINVGLVRKKNITNVVATPELMPFFELVDSNCIVNEKQINPDAILLKENEKEGGLGITAALFDVAENHIFTLMATDSVPKFIKTRAYHDTVSSLIKSGALQIGERSSEGDDDEEMSQTASVDLAKFTHLQRKNTNGSEFEKIPEISEATASKNQIAQI